MIEMEIKFRYAVIAFGVVLASLLIYGYITCSIPGMICANRRTVTVKTHTEAYAFCIGAYSLSKISQAVVSPNICTPEAGDPMGDLTLNVYDTYNPTDQPPPIYTISKNSECNCMPWGCAKDQTFTICLEPGKYYIQMMWRGEQVDPFGWKIIVVS